MGRSELRSWLAALHIIVFFYARQEMKPLAGFYIFLLLPLMEGNSGVRPIVGVLTFARHLFIVQLPFALYPFAISPYTRPPHQRLP